MGEMVDVKPQTIQEKIVNSQQLPNSKPQFLRLFNNSSTLALNESQHIVVFFCRCVNISIYIVNVYINKS